MGGLFRKLKVTGWTFLVACLAIAGIFPLAGFFSKDEILAAIHESRLPGHEALLVVALFTAFLTAFYMFRLFFTVFLGTNRTPVTPGHEHEPHESPFNMTIPLMVLGLLSVVAGWINWPGVGAFTSFLEGRVHPEAFHWDMVAFSSLVALGGIALSAAFYWKNSLSAKAVAERNKGLYALLVNKYYIDEIWAWLVQNVLFRLAASFAWFDKHVVDGGMVDGAGALTRTLGFLVRRTQTGQVQRYALVVFASVAVFYLILSF
jgi:NADH-quinone oxidoreductase subunit L